MALLLLAHAAVGPRLSAITIDHGLRPEAAAEARHVAGVCARRGIPHRIATAPIEPLVGNVQAWARRIRYDILAEAAHRAGALVATGHHADDQLETMLMRLARGSGVAGLAGIRARAGAVVRPLLGWRRAELAAVVGACGEVAVDDPSNRDDRFDRARLRKRLADAPWLDPLAAVRSAAALADAEAAIDWAANEAWLRCATEARDAHGHRVTLDARALGDEALPRELKRRLLRRALDRVDAGHMPREAVLARALSTLRAGGATTIGRVLVRPVDGQWVFAAAPARRPMRDAG